MAESLFVTLAKPFLSLMAYSRLPKTDGRIRLAGLRAPVEILWDSWGVPHIYAKNEHDLFFAQGYVHAQDRLWQMEFNRRLVAGCLSEVLGEIALPLDRWMRTLTLRHVAEFEVPLLQEEVKQAFQAYANGVNAFIAQGRLPLEFTLLRYRPRPWQIADSLSWIKMMSWTLSVNWESELLRAVLVSLLGAETVAEFDTIHLSRWPYIVPPGSDYSYIGPAALERALEARPFSGPSPYEGLGSNVWALHGKRTCSGKPILANDMHLQLTAPSIWYENHLSCSELNVTGVAFPAIPGVVAGHNGFVAWGFTNGFADVQDLYLERLRRTPTDEVEYEYMGIWKKARVLREIIPIRGKKPFIEEVVITHHGPIINSLASDLAGEQPLALCWTSLEPDRMGETIFGMMRAKDCREFHLALRQWTAPVQNVVYADIHGNIAYTYVGKIPLRRRGDGRLPVPGWVDDYEWVGYLPFDALPHLFNPPQGYIVSANNHPISEDYPLPFPVEPISGDRAQRISEMILDSSLRGGEERIDLAFVKKMHTDWVSPSARAIARHFKQLTLNPPVNSPQTEIQETVELLRQWDGELARDSIAAAIYQVFIRKLAALLFEAQLSKSLLGFEKNNLPLKQADIVERMMGKGPTPILAEAGLFGEHWLPWLSRLLEVAESPFYDLGNGEKREDTLLLALELALKELKKRLGEDKKHWTWGSLHQVTFRHALSSDSLMASLFNVGPFPLGGDSTTIWASGTSYHNLATDMMIGPPYRMIVDLADLDNSMSVLAPGQSGHPASPHYCDQVQAWLRGEYHPMLFRRESVEKATRHRLFLHP